MATLSKHGEHVIIEYVWYRKAYCADGAVLVNYGDGWKVSARLNDGFDWKTVAIRKIKDRDAMYCECPAFARFANLVNALVGGYCNRPIVKAALSLLSDDPDGMWSELNDHGRYGNDAALELSIDDCVKLCRGCTAAVAELKERQQERRQSA